MKLSELSIFFMTYSSLSTINGISFKSRNMLKPFSLNLFAILFEKCKLSLLPYEIKASWCPVSESASLDSDEFKKSVISFKEFKATAPLAVTIFFKFSNCSICSGLNTSSSSFDKKQ